MRQNIAIAAQMLTSNKSRFLYLIFFANYMWSSPQSKSLRIFIKNTGEVLLSRLLFQRLTSPAPHRRPRIRLPCEPPMPKVVEFLGSNLSSSFLSAADTVKTQIQFQVFSVSFRKRVKHFEKIFQKQQKILFSHLFSEENFL